MNTRLLSFAFRMLPALALVINLSARAQFFPHPPEPQHFAGTISDYSPSNVSGGPWEVRGKWTLDIRGDFADFSGAVSMETSDYGVTTGSIKDPTMVMDRSPHTHHITMTHAMVTVTTTPTGCGTSFSPATTGPVIVITGPVSVTGNGGPASFEAKGPSSLEICLSGGSVVPYSNFSMIFTGTATGHFGSQPFTGVIIKPHAHEPAAH